MNSVTDIVLALVAIGLATLVVAIGGIYHPNTIAGSVARFVFSLN